MTRDRNEDEGFTVHEPGRGPAEQGDNPEAPVPGGGTQGISNAGARGSMSGGAYGTGELDVLREGEGDEGK